MRLFCFYGVIIFLSQIVLLTPGHECFGAESNKIDNLTLADMVEKTLQKLDPIIVLYIQKRDQDFPGKPNSKWKSVNLFGTQGIGLTNRTDFMENITQDEMDKNLPVQRQISLIKNGFSYSLNTLLNHGTKSSNQVLYNLIESQCISSWFKQHSFTYYPDLIRNKYDVYVVPENLEIINNKVTIVVRYRNSKLYGKDKRKKITFDLLRGALLEAYHLEQLDLKTNKWYLRQAYDVVEWQKLDDGTDFPKICEYRFPSSTKKGPSKLLTTKLTVLQVKRPKNFDHIVSDFRFTVGCKYYDIDTKTFHEVGSGERFEELRNKPTNCTLVKRALGMELEEFNKLYDDLKW